MSRLSLVRLTCLTALAACLPLAACSNPATSSPIYTASDAIGSLDVSLGEGLSSDVSATKADSGGDKCSCGGLQCGKPAGCSKSCGECNGANDLICLDNQCVADPSCECHAGQCGFLPGCKKQCPGCPGKQACQQNACVATCSCAGIECGFPAEGCTKDCGQCQAGFFCSATKCAADPKCECKPGQCGVLPGCGGESCDPCGGGLACKANKCVASSDPCDCGALKCGPAKTSCGTTCGLCEINQFCEAHSCVTFGPDSKHKFGEPCGPGGICQPPPLNAGFFAVKKYLTCLDNTCETQRCSNGVCTKACTIAADAVQNSSGAAGADGIEDPNAPSGCGGAVDGPAGGEFHCIEQATAFQVQEGQGDSLCQPGTTYKPCSRDGDCSTSETCRVYAVLGSLVSRCGPRMHDPAGAISAKGSQSCNENTDSGNIHLCQNGLCTTKGCMDLCKGDADCVTQPGQCKAGTCSSTGLNCASDADCPKWKCKAGVTVSPIDDTVFSACQP